MIYAAFVLILFIFILFLPVKIETGFENKNTFLEIYIGKFRVHKNQKKRKAEPREPQKEAGEFEKKTKSFTKKIKEFSSLCTRAARLLKKYVHLEEISLDVTLGTGDAPTTAIGTGGLWAVSYALVGAVGKIMQPEKYNVLVTPDYSETKFRAKGKCILKSRIVYIIIIAISILTKIKAFGEE